MKTQTSAGGVIMCSVGHRWYVLVLKDMNGAWTFPKGLIEKGESREESARREMYEEVGISRVKMLAPLTPIQYIFKRNGIIKKTIHYFVFTTKTRILPKPQEQEGISEARWLPIKQVIEIIGYRETNVPILEEVWKLLKRRTSTI